MKSRILTLFIAAAFIRTVTIYAEDAITLPAGTLRVDADASTGFVREGWDGDSRKADAPDATIIGAALGISYGFTDWFTLVLDWAPGVTDTDLSDIDFGNDGDGEGEIYEGLSDFLLKAQFLIIGNNAPVSSERFRMRLAPGMVIPFPGIDDKDSLGNHTWGLGGDVSFDTLVTDNFFVNVFSEAYWFPAPADNKSKTNNEWEIALEAGPHYSVTFGSVRLGFALPLNWKVSPENAKGIVVDGVSSHLLTPRPGLELKLTHPFAVDIGIEYTLPLYGKNDYAVHTITIKAPVYFNFAKNKGGE
jgi:hypothetical protein